MSEVEKIEQQQSVVTDKPKQYLLMVDDVTMAILGRLTPTMRFLEVEGMNMEGNDKCMLLVSPTRKP